MKLQEIFDLGVQMGIVADPRGEEAVKKLLEKRKKEYNELSEKKKKYFDTEDLAHPYTDSRVYIGDPQKEIKTVIAAIDVGTGEMVLVDRLREKGMAIDAVITHHPHGEGLAALHEVMEMLTDTSLEIGVPVNVADAILRERMKTVHNRFVGVPNHNQTVDAARLLDIPLISMHTIWDNMGSDFMKGFVKKASFETVGELLEQILTIPEFEMARKYKAEPFIAAGSVSSRAGKVVVEFTGGTNLGKDIIPEYAKAGVGTVIQMHITEDEIKEMKKYHINAIDTGHIPSDSIGANLFLDQLEKQGVNVIEFGGLLRVKR